MKVLAKLGFWVDGWGRDAREKYARETATRAGYGVLDIGDALVRYRLHGSGPSVVFVADPPIVLEHYDELVRELSTDHTVIVFETPGFGFSTLRAGVSLAFDDVGDALARTLRALDRGPYVLAFPCVSAYAALGIAHRHPELVSKLVLSQAPSWREALRWKAARDPLGVLSQPVLGQLALRAAQRRRAPEWISYAIGAPQYRDALIATSDRALRAGAGFSLASVFQNYLVEGHEPTPVEHEAVFIWGLRDRSHRKTDRRSSLALAPRGRVIEAAELGHFPELEAPRWFADVIRSVSTR